MILIKLKPHQKVYTENNTWYITEKYDCIKKSNFFTKNKSIKCLSGKEVVDLFNNPYYTKHNDILTRTFNGNIYDLLEKGQYKYKSKICKVIKNLFFKEK